MKVFQEFFGVVDLFDGKAALAGDLGQAVHLQVMEVAGHKCLWHREIQTFFALHGRDLKEQAFLEGTSTKAHGFQTLLQNWESVL